MERAMLGISLTTAQILMFEPNSKMENIFKTK